MAETKSDKPGSKAAETTLSLLGALGSVAGPLLFGPESTGIDFGAPFRAGAASLAQKRQEGDLMKYLMASEQTAPLATHIPAIISAGGIMNNQDLLDHPDVQAMFSGGTASAPVPASAGVLPGESGGMPSNLMTALQPAPRSGPSPELQARVFQDHPELMKAASGNGLDDILKVLQIQSFETPEEKRKARLEDRKATLEATDALIQGRHDKRVEDDRQTKRQEWTPKEDDNFYNLQASIDTNRALLEKSKQGVHPSLFTAALGATPVGQAMLQRLAPEEQEMMDQIQMVRDIGRKTMTDVKAQSGAAYSAAELNWMQSALPSKWDKQEQFEKSLIEDTRKKLWLMYNTAAAKVQKAGNLEPATARGITPEQLRAFSFLKKQLEGVSGKNAEAAINTFDNPNNAQYLQILGMP